MKKVAILSLLLLFGCGSLRVNPKNCKTDAIWGASPNSSREITREELEEEKVLDLSAQDDFYVFTDRDIRLRDILENHGIKCEEVKKIRVQIKTSWFVKREVSLKVVKK